MLMAFDMPESNVTCLRRDRSNTPLQALTLWNDPVFVDCARALAGRAARESTGELHAAARRAFELALSRPASSTERARIDGFVERMVRRFSDDPEAARELALAADTGSQAHAERAALIALARVLLNLDEFVTRD